MKFIVKHKNYLDMPNRYKINGDINWVAPSNKERAAWWDKKIKKLKCINRAEVARKIYPKELHGFKPCQVCGKELNIHYVYPNKNSLKKLNNLNTGIRFKPYDKDIAKIFDIISSKIGNKAYDTFKKIFDIPDEIEINEKKFKKFILSDRTSRLSPGVMSNAPDRLDGFHTYNACCRHKQDTGRHKSNLSRYTQDRRAYEFWSDGNWNLSNRLMGEFQRFPDRFTCPVCGKKRKLTADHIGPISLGFAHRPNFNPLCKSCNSKKNNRLTIQDVKSLIKDEKKGEKVISWHSQYIWDLRWTGCQDHSKCFCRCGM